MIYYFNLYDLYDIETNLTDKMSGNKFNTLWLFSSVQPLSCVRLFVTP